MLKFGILPEVRSVDRVRRLGRSLGRLWVCKDWGSGFLSNLVYQRSRESRHVKMAGMSDASREAAFVAFEAEFSRNGSVFTKSCCVQLFFQEALLWNPAFLQLSETWRPYSFTACLCHEAWRNPQARTCQAIQMHLGNFMGKLNSVQTISEFRILFFFRVTYLDRSALWNET